MRRTVVLAGKMEVTDDMVARHIKFTNEMKQRAGDEASTEAPAWAKCLEQTVAGLAAKVEAIDQKLDGAVARVEGNVAALAAKVEAFDEKLDAAVARVEGNVAALAAKVEAFDEKLDAAVARVEGKVDAVAVKVEAIEGVVGAMAARVEALDGAVGAMAVKVEALDGAVGAMAVKVEALDGAVGAVAAKVDGMEDTLRSVKLQAEATHKRLQSVAALAARAENARVLSVSQPLALVPAAGGSDPPPSAPRTIAELNAMKGEKLNELMVFYEVECSQAAKGALKRTSIGLALGVREEVLRVVIV
jgi:chromosome segregation ATPase